MCLEVYPLFAGKEIKLDVHLCMVELFWNEIKQLPYHSIVKVITLLICYDILQPEASVPSGRQSYQSFTRL